VTQVPAAWLDQLAARGSLCTPVGSSTRDQRLLLLRREADGTFTRRDLGGVRFVPLVPDQDA
jgi:protein-L-isoaspartate O-methyltransferase